MTIVHTVSPRTSGVRRPINGPAQEPGRGRDRTPGARGRRASRPPGAPPRYHGTGVAMSYAPHRRRPVTWAKTAGLAVAAGLITLWLGLIANVGQAINGEASASAASAALAVHMPDRLAIVRVEPGESVQDVAHRVAPDAPVRQVADRIRDLNGLDSPALVAGQPLIAPVG